MGKHRAMLPLLLALAPFGCASAPGGVDPPADVQASSAASPFYRAGLASLHAAGTATSAPAARLHLEEAARLFGQAVAADGSSAPALAALAETHLLINLQDPERLEQARGLARRALAISGLTARAHEVEGWLHFFVDRNYAAARASFERALSLDPELVFARYGYGLFLASQGELDGGLAEVERAEQNGLIRPTWRMGSPAVLFFARRYAEAEARSLAPLPGSPSSGPDFFWLGNARLQRGDVKGAIEAFEQRISQSRQPGAVAGLAAAHARAGHEEEAARLRRENGMLMEQNVARGEPACARLPCHMFATAYLAAGDRETAMRLLQQAEAGRPQLGVWAVWTKVDPRLDPLRDDPRFRGVLQAAGFASGPAADPAR